MSSITYATRGNQLTLSDSVAFKPQTDASFLVRNQTNGIFHAQGFYKGMIANGKRTTFWEENFLKLMATVTITSVFALFNVCNYKYVLVTELLKLGINKITYSIVLYFIDFFMLLILVFYMCYFRKMKESNPDGMGRKKFVLGLLPSVLCFIIAVIVTII